MRNWSRTRVNGFRTITTLMSASVLAAGVVSPAWAARPGGGGGGGSSNGPSGNDVSYPQCGSTLPSSPAFAIVGVNGGLANNLNSCFGPSSSYPSYTQSELYWATTSATGTGITTQPKVGLYVNTADPGNEYNGTPINDWPTSSDPTKDPWGSCRTTTILTSSNTSATVGENSPACAWQYGYNMASQDLMRLVNAAGAINKQETTLSISSSPSQYGWWLDVETANSWQSGSSGQEMNAADLQGMYDALTSASSATKVGIYSTSSQWSSIAGNYFSLALPDWIPGARTQSGAISNCSLAPFSGGPVTVTQWTSHSLDSDYTC